MAYEELKPTCYAIVRQGPVVRPSVAPRTRWERRICTLAAFYGYGSGSAVLYFTCFNAKLDLMLATPGIFAT